MSLKARLNRGVLLVLAFVLSDSDIRADDAAQLDAASQEALQKTQALLRNSTEREKAAQATPEAKKAAEHLNAVTGGNEELKSGIYSLSADVLQELAGIAGGDPLKMQEIMTQAQANPQAFKARLSPASQRAIEEMAKKVESQPKRVP